MVRRQRVSRPSSEFLKILFLSKCALYRIYKSSRTILGKKNFIGGLVNTLTAEGFLKMSEFSAKKKVISELYGDVSTKSK